jgi:predicted ATPase
VFEERVGTVGVSAAEELTSRKDSEETSVYAFKEGGDARQQQLLLRRIAESLPSSALARWDVEELAMPSRLPDKRRFPFDPSGYGLATCLAEMKLGRGSHFEALRDDFCAQFPAFRDIFIQRTDVQSVERTPHFQKQQGSRGEGYALVLLRKDGVEVPAALASSGTLVTLAFLTLIHLEEPRKLLLIEEPENALHPGRLKEIMTLLRRPIALRNDCQIVVTTHSPLLLDYVDPAEVRVFLRNERDDVEVYNLAAVSDIRERLKYLMLGELVYNEGEQELAKEIQQHANSHSGRGAD